MLENGEVTTPQFRKVWTWMVLTGQGVTRNGSGDGRHQSSTDTPDSWSGEP